eukprot:3441687-Rhodomonas_salina.1
MKLAGSALVLLLASAGAALSSPTSLTLYRPSTGNFRASAPASLKLRGGGELALDSEAQKVLAFSACAVTASGVCMVLAPDMMCNVLNMPAGTFDKTNLDYGTALLGWGVGKWTAASTSKEASVKFSKLNLVWPS